MSKKDLAFFIDDEPELIFAYSSTLSDDYQVEVFQSAEEAIRAIINGSEPSVIVSDLNMPNMSGLDLCKMIKENGCVSPVILMSGYLDKELSIQAVNNGVYGVMEKPVRLNELKSLVDSAIVDYRKVVREKNFKESANQFVEVSKNIMANYRHRFEESERLLKSVGLLPHNPEKDMKEIFGTVDLERQLDRLVQHLDELNQHKNELPVVLKKVA